MLDAVGHPVESLRRIRFGPLGIRGLRPGDWRDLTDAEVEKLKSGKVEK
jgi:23S rRNA pseudouridine2605 synthase